MAVPSVSDETVSFDLAESLLPLPVRVLIDFVLYKRHCGFAFNAIVTLFVTESHNSAAVIHAVYR